MKYNIVETIVNKPQVELLDGSQVISVKHEVEVTYIESKIMQPEH